MSDNLFVTYVKKGTESNISVVNVKDGKPYAAEYNHPNFDKIVELAMKDDAKVLGLFDIAGTIHDHFQPLSDRVSARMGKLYLDGDEMSGTIVDLILRDQREGGENWKGLVKFIENLHSNPSSRSRDEAYRWLSSAKFTIDEDGMVVGYKYVDVDGKGGYQSCHHGPAIVDGKPHLNGAVPNNPGSIITMARSQVDDNAHQTCSTGLHVGNWAFVSGHSRTILEVRVNPRDIVSIPTDHGDAKMRVCRYEVVDIVTKPHETASVPAIVKSKPKDEKKEAAKNAKKDGKHPSHTAWITATNMAKAKKKGVGTEAAKKGWTLIDASAPKERTSWVVA